MLSKLVLRNAGRSLKLYMIYLFTMILVAALMFSFHSMIFSEEIRSLSQEAGMFGILILMALYGQLHGAAARKRIRHIYAARLSQEADRASVFNGKYGARRGGARHRHGAGNLFSAGSDLRNLRNSGDGIAWNRRSRHATGKAACISSL